MTDTAHSDLIGYEFDAQVARLDSGGLGTGAHRVRVVGPWPCNEAYVLCAILGTGEPGKEESLIRPASVVRAARDLQG